MKKSLLAITITTALALTACNPNTPTTESNSDTASKEVVVDINKTFDSFKEKLIDDLWKQYPGYAVYYGYYKYDDVLTIEDEASRNKNLALTKMFLSSLNEFDVEKLDAGNASDFYILKNQLESSIWYAKSFRSYEWDPSNYNVAGVFGVILNTDYKDKDERLRTIYRRMENIPAYYQAAQTNLTSPTIPHTELGIQQNKGAVGLFEASIANAVKESGLSDEEKQAFEERNNAAIAAINNYVSFLESKLSQLKESGNARDFRIGKELYDAKFKYDIFSGYSAEELYEKAKNERDRVHQESIKIAQQLWLKYFPYQTFPEDPFLFTKAVIDHISVKHVKRDEFVSSIRAQIPELEKFVIDNKLIEMDKEKPLVVRETPEYQRGFAGASINAPGPYDATANTYYNVTPLDNFNDEEAESYLREYNHWILQILNIHEAVPGHYTQLVHANKSPSLVKSIFGNGAMIEGWAVYTERMMLEEGYGNFEPELWLMFYKWNLRAVMNAILDYEIQVKGLSEEDALDMMINQAFQEESEAKGKWRRATLSQVQLTSYFTGYSEIYAFREEQKKALGDKFSLLDFHNTFLSFGSAPVPIIKELMTK